MPELEKPIVQGRDARLFPGIELELFTLDDLLVPVRRGAFVPESLPGATPSYWCVIPQCGRVWVEPTQRDGWARAAFALMLVNDTENHAHQGLATFRYQGEAVSELRFQFVQQSAPYLLAQHFVAWGIAELARVATLDDEARHRAAARAELAQRLPCRPLDELIAELPPRLLDGFGGPVKPEWRIQAALVRHGILYYQQVSTPYGLYPYPQEMRFGVRSVMKSIAAPLSLLRLAQVYGPYVLDLKIGDFVAGLDPKYRRVRFIDAANMASGYGGHGSWRTQPNDIHDGYLEGDYDGWYTAPSHAEKLAHIIINSTAYPWEPGAVMRYRDQDFYLLGAAIEGFLKTRGGAQADVWEMLEREVFAPIGIARAPAVRTLEGKGEKGVVWFNAGYYPTLDDLAKIALLYQDLGEWNGQQLLHRELARELLAAKDAIVKQAGASTDVDGAPRYKMGFHFTPYLGAGARQWRYLPTMQGSGENEVVLYPNRMISLRLAKAAQLPQGEQATDSDEPTTIAAVERLEPFEPEPAMGR